MRIDTADMLHLPSALGDVRVVGHKADNTVLFLLRMRFKVFAQMFVESCLHITPVNAVEAHHAVENVIADTPCHARIIQMRYTLGSKKRQKYKISKLFGRT